MFLNRTVFLSCSNCSFNNEQIQSLLYLERHSEECTLRMKTELSHTNLFQCSSQAMYVFSFYYVWHILNLRGINEEAAIRETINYRLLERTIRKMLWSELCEKKPMWSQASQLSLSFLSCQIGMMKPCPTSLIKPL